MFIVNDMEVLSRLAKFKILQSMLAECSIAISGVRLSEYSFMIRKEIEQHPAISVLQAGADFHSWCLKRPPDLSLGDISSLYMVSVNSGSSLVLSDEDIFLQQRAIERKIKSIAFDDFVLQIIKDEKMIQLYKLIKAA